MPQMGLEGLEVGWYGGRLELAMSEMALFLSLSLSLSV